MASKKDTDCSSDPTPCSAADGPQLTINAGRSADDVFSIVKEVLIEYAERFTREARMAAIERDDEKCVAFANQSDGVLKAFAQICKIEKAYKHR